MATSFLFLLHVIPVSRCCSVPDNIYNWIKAFFEQHFHCTRYAGECSTVAALKASVIQGSGLGPASFIVTAADLHPNTPGNCMFCPRIAHSCPSLLFLPSCLKLVSHCPYSFYGQARSVNAYGHPKICPGYGLYGEPDRTRILLKSKKPVRSIRSARSCSRSAYGLYTVRCHLSKDVWQAL